MILAASEQTQHLVNLFRSWNMKFLHM